MFLHIHLGCVKYARVNVSLSELFLFHGNSDGISMKQKRSAEDAQLAEMKIVALQHRSRAKSSQANSLCLVYLTKNNEIQVSDKRVATFYLVLRIENILCQFFIHMKTS